ncbi:class I SAM-dependent methyltransferase [Desulfosporosinus nitroreducens]|uniref:class I SAM-dependent methyltransferase n=1 Tax=Desulfosporosinus nitroreducens TaxID=2018668 RepID=UPI00207CCFA8|nr:class I SAM-dependent methyltransferase [Desulfosporosinus nitroreducens]MCO1602401.1 class I SAM-dependent methyltransferase [Desulfosporosinus nitroreducens]
MADLTCRKKEAWESLLIKYVGRGENLQVLDVGTGDGFLAILLAGLDYSVTAIDPLQIGWNKLGKTLRHQERTYAF